MKANVYFDYKGEFIPALCREINFTTIAGAKRALINVIRKAQNSLYMQYGGGKTITVIATTPDTPDGEYFLKTTYTTNYGLV